MLEQEGKGSGKENCKERVKILSKYGKMKAAIDKTGGETAGAEVKERGQGGDGAGNDTGYCRLSFHRNLGVMQIR